MQNIFWHRATRKQCQELITDVDTDSRFCHWNVSYSLSQTTDLNFRKASVFNIQLSAQICVLPNIDARLEMAHLSVTTQPARMADCDRSMHCIVYRISEGTWRWLVTVIFSKTEKIKYVQLVAYLRLNKMIFFRWFWHSAVLEDDRRL